jgi:hypothetical protein
MDMYKKIICFILFVACAGALPSCRDEGTDTLLGNDCIKRSLGPNLVGLDIEFAYAMALPPSAGKLISAQVEASIAGAPETWMESKSYYTNTSGVDVGVPVGESSVNNGATTKVTFNVDTCAATLRYYYRIPEEARGRKVSFVFSAEASNGEKVTYELGPYDVAVMDHRLDLEVSNERCYISIADMAAYTAGEAPGAERTDLVYFYHSNSAFLHCLLAPSAIANIPAAYRSEIRVPSGATNHTLIRKTWNLRDRHLARLQYGIYIDDVDFQTLDMTGMPDWAFNLRAEAGAWVETSDGKYRAYIFFNRVNNGGTAVISMKRYTMK